MYHLFYTWIWDQTASKNITFVSWACKMHAHVNWWNWTTLSLQLVITTQGSKDNVNRFFFPSCAFLLVVIRIINCCSFQGLLSTNSIKKGEMSFPRRKLHKVKAMVPGKKIHWNAALCTVIFSFNVYIWIKPRNISTFSEVSELVFTFAA